MIRALQNSVFRIDLMVGPKPSDLIKQIQINQEQIIPPLWTFGIHVCYQSTKYNTSLVVENLDDLKSAVNGNQFPIDSFCVHDKVMSVDNLDDILRKNVLDGIAELKKLNKRLLASVVPQVCLLLLKQILTQRGFVWGMAGVSNCVSATCTEKIYITFFLSISQLFILWSLHSKRIIFKENKVEIHCYIRVGRSFPRFLRSIFQEGILFICILFVVKIIISTVIPR